MALIELKDVTKKYDKSTTALRHIDLSINSGEFVYLVGPSGAGKSSLIRLFYQEEKLTSGSMKVGEFDLTRLRKKDVPLLRRSIGVVFQDYKLLPKKTAFENVAYAMQVIGKKPREIKRRVLEVLDLVGLKHKVRVFPDELSGGEQQRIAIARAIIKDSPIIVLDEATAFSDPENEYLIQNAFEKLMQGKTVIIIAHRLSTIRNADKIIVMEKGHLIEEGKHDELVAAGGRYAQMWNHYTEAIGWKISGKAV